MTPRISRYAPRPYGRVDGDAEFCLDAVRDVPRRGVHGGVHHARLHGTGDTADPLTQRNPLNQAGQNGRTRGIRTSQGRCCARPTALAPGTAINSSRPVSRVAVDVVGMASRFAAVDSLAVDILGQGIRIDGGRARPRRAVQIPRFPYGTGVPFDLRLDPPPPSPSTPSSSLVDGGARCSVAASDRLRAREPNVDEPPSSAVAISSSSSETVVGSPIAVGVARSVGEPDDVGEADKRFQPAAQRASPPRPVARRRHARSRRLAASFTAPRRAPGELLDEPLGIAGSPVSRSASRKERERDLLPALTACLGRWLPAKLAHPLASLLGSPAIGGVRPLKRECCQRYAARTTL